MKRAETILIIGGGQAAQQLASSLRQNGSQARIVLISAEHSIPYHRPPLSKKFLMGELPAEKLLIRKAEYYSEHDIEVRLGSMVLLIDRVQKRVLLAGGEALTYDTLVLATGGRARTLNCIPANMAGVHSIREMPDVLRLQSEVEHQPRAVLVGGGYIGLEVASSLRQLGCEVVVLEAQQNLLSRSVASPMSTAIADIHKRHGCEIRCGLALQSIEGEKAFRAVVTTTGERFPGEILVVGVGMQPNTELAEAAGLRCNNGILVDESCRTNDPCIYAIGDVANQYDPLTGEHRRLESVDNAVQMAKTAAAVIAGMEPPGLSPPWFWSDQYDARLQMVGLPGPSAECVTRQISGSHKLGCFFVNGEKLVAAQCLNAGGDFMAAKTMIAAETKVNPAQLSDPSVRLRELR